LPHLFVVLNWGRGHATRSIPLIQNLINEGKEVVLGADGEVKNILQDQFPQLKMEILPSLNFKSGSHVARSILFHLPNFMVWFIRDYIWMRRNKYRFSKVISDGRLSMAFAASKMAIFINHQWGGDFRTIYGLFVLALTHFCAKAKFEIWFPGNPEYWPWTVGDQLKMKYTGPLSSISVFPVRKNTLDFCISLSGPPAAQDHLLQTLLPILEHRQLSFSVLGYGGSKFPFPGFISGNKRDELWSSSKAVVGFFGYSTLMDIMANNKKAILLAINGQWEQEFLLKNIRFDDQIFGLHQNEVNLKSKLEEIITLRI
jgi:hypothetical protein